MPNPTRQEIINAQLARQWAEWNKSCEVSSPEIQAAANFILAHTNPLTMAEVEWDDDKHYLAEAEVRTESEGGVKVVMLNPTPSRQILCLRRAYSMPGAYRVSPAHLTPTGKRYTLTEVQE